MIVSSLVQFGILLMLSLKNLHQHHRQLQQQQLRCRYLPCLQQWETQEFQTQISARITCETNHGLTNVY